MTLQAARLRRTIKNLGYTPAWVRTDVRRYRDNGRECREYGNAFASIRGYVSSEAVVILRSLNYTVSRYDGFVIVSGI
jgi:hypothetical protein